MKNTIKKAHLIKSLLAVTVLVAMLVSGLGTAKSYAYSKGSSYTAETNCRGVVDRIIKGIYRAEDMLYNSYLENVYGMVLNKRYEFAGSTLVKIASNTDYLRRNFDEETVYSEPDGYFAVRDRVMDKAVQYWNKKGSMVISLYYRNKHDRKPSYVCYRFEKKNDTDIAGFFTYDMQGNLVDVWAFDEYYSGIKCDIYKADYASCGYLVKLIDDFIDYGQCREVGPAVIKVAGNTTYLKRHYHEEVHYAYEEESEEAGFFVQGIRMEKVVQYWNDNGAVFSLFYEKETDRKPSYVTYRFQSRNDSDKVVFATYDIHGVLLDEWHPAAYYEGEE